MSKNYNSALHTVNSSLDNVITRLSAFPNADTVTVFALQDKTVTPSADDQIITADTGYIGLATVTVKGDGNLVAENIINGKAIFGVTGTAPNTECEDAIVEGRLIDYTNTRITDVENLSHCSVLRTVNFPNIVLIGALTFAYCSRLVRVNFPKATTIAGQAFLSCTNLAQVSFPSATLISGSAFASCRNLTSIYLGASSGCLLSTSMAFVRTGITSSTGSIFVPASLVNVYKSATNWAYFANRIFSYVF